LKRLKGAIDARIAEETARQKSAQQSQTPPRSNSSPRRSSSRNLSPSKRTSRPKDGESSKAAPTGKGPDPSEFDPEFVIGDEDEQPSRIGTPRPKDKAEATETAGGAAAEGTGKAQNGEVAPTEEKDTSPPELPLEVQTRLRKLDKLEPKYTGRTTNT
jgi:hypothetical protein